MKQGLLLWLVPWCDGGVTQSAAAPASSAERDSRGLEFVAEMYGLQQDQLATLLAVTTRQARALITSWTARQLAASAVLGPGPPWVWLTRTGLRACGLRYTAAPPALPRLAHIRATAAVRLTLQAAPGALAQRAPDEIAARRQAWRPRPPPGRRGALA